MTEALKNIPVRCVYIFANDEKGEEAKRIGGFEDFTHSIVVPLWKAFELKNAFGGDIYDAEVWEKANA